MDEFAKYPDLVDNVLIYYSAPEAGYLYDINEPSVSLEHIKQNFWNKYQSSNLNIGYFSGWSDLDYNLANVSYLKSGRLWNHNDENTMKVWVSEDFIYNALKKGVHLQVGDDIVLAFVTNRNNETGDYSLAVEKFSIGGIFLNNALRELKISNNVFINVLTAANLLNDDLSINGIKVINDPRIQYNFEHEFKKMTEVVTRVNSIIQPEIYKNRTKDRFRCDIVDTLAGTRLAGLISIGAIVFISFIILLMSIGGVANSIIISVDKNRRFLGVMMAVGLNKRGVKRLVQYEALAVIFLATGAAYGALTYFAKDLGFLLDFMLRTIMDDTGFESSVLIPVYIPVVSMAAFVIMALLFSKSSLKRIVNMDVVTVISEVS